MMAFDQLKARDIQDTVRLLSEALREFERGLTEKPGNRELTELLDTTRTDLGTIVNALIHRPNSQEW